MKTSLASIPTSVPTRPLKENKAKVIPNYIKKARQNGNYNDEYDDEEEAPPPKITPGASSR